MKHRREEQDAEKFEDFAADDAYLDALSRGEAPGGADDELGALFLALREEVEAPMPQFELDELAVRRYQHRQRRRGPGPVAGGLLGAAAATLVIVGGGSVLYNADADSPFYGLAGSVFGDRTAMVELAGTLEQVDAKVSDGDTDGAMTLLGQARLILSSLSKQPPPAETTTATVTVPTTEPPATTPAEEPATPTATVTVTATETATVTETVTAPPSTAAPTSAEPSASATSTDAVGDPRNAEYGGRAPWEFAEPTPQTS